LRRVAGGLRRAMAWTAALACAGVGALLLVFPRVMSITIAVVAFWLALCFGLFAMQRRRAWKTADEACPAVRPTSGGRPASSARDRARDTGAGRRSPTLRAAG